MTLKKKKYVHLLLFSIVLFLLFHGLVWTFITGKFFKNRFNTGDQARLSYQVGMLFPRENTVDLPVKHMRFKTYEKIDILTVGDSFSNGFSRGKNPFYQDYIASINNYKVMNISPFNDDGYALETIIALNNSGALDKLKPKAIIIEAVERRAISRFAKEHVDWNLTYSEDKIREFLLKEYYDYIPDPTFINKLNYNAVIYNILYHFNDHAFLAKTYLATLSKDFFTGNIANKMLFYYEDLTYRDWASKENIALLNDNFNTLQALLEKKGIKLYFMPAADKSNVYADYIVSKEYPKSHFFERLRELPKAYGFIDTKKVLKKMVDEGVKDVYYKDDTHWSYKASKAIFSEYLHKTKE